MSNRFDVPPRSRGEIRKIARAVRAITNSPEKAAVDVLEFVENILPDADPEFEFHVVEDHVLRGREAETYPDKKVIRVTETVYRKANMGERRARFTIAHELGHLFLHRGIGLRLARVAANQEIPAYRDSEWQADSFAGEYLMDAKLYAKCESVQEAAELFQVSYMAAKVQGRAYRKDGLIGDIAGL